MSAREGQRDFTDISAFGVLLPPEGALLGLDVGTKTIGVALSDPGRRIASPIGVIGRTKFSADALHLLRQADEHRIAGIVIGFPINLDGSEGPRAQATRAFARNLANRTSIPLVLWDERLSTAAVERVLIEANRSRARRADLVDKVAAAYILQGALDRMRR